MLKRLLRKLYTWRSSGHSVDDSIDIYAFGVMLFPLFVDCIRGICRQLVAFRTPTLLFLGSRVQISGWRWIRIGQGTKLGRCCELSALGASGLSIGERVTIGPFTRIFVTSNFRFLGKGIVLGDRVAIGDYSHIGGSGGVVIGKNTIIGPYFSCHPENHLFKDLTIPIRDQGVSRQGITIGENCWIGAKVTVLDGVTIGNGCVVAAGSVVTRNIDDNLVVGGVPARTIRSRD